ncbi:hypothetical protein A3L09_00675 [Thermococcus profundus]|uniref:Uncharacterized protein n=1 Tax=Thermococcus profundus TaxID=49899 RepID=A0A2Z2MBF5_THEPR|nr:hypothetical protein [Thermococcus profundus]ASJ01875.1 hypothetical protein A3L09_00675 [Thermococcus profundus]
MDKLLPEVTEENLEVLGRAIHKDTDDPFVVLRNAGIDIEPELEEFRQFLEEISGKNAQKLRPSKAPRETSPDLSKEAAKLLGLLRGLKYAHYPKEAVDGIRKELEIKVEALIKKPEENLELLGLYFTIIRLIKAEKFEDAEKLLERLEYA